MSLSFQVHQSEGTRRLRRLLTIPTSGKGSKTDTSFGIATVVALFLDGKGEVDAQRDFVLSLGAHDLRMIMPSEHLGLCEVSLGVEILCCALGLEHELYSCLPSTTDVLIVFVGHEIHDRRTLFMWRY